MVNLQTFQNPQSYVSVKDEKKESAQGFVDEERFKQESRHTVQSRPTVQIRPTVQLLQPK